MKCACARVEPLPTPVMAAGVLSLFEGINGFPLEVAAAGVLAVALLACLPGIGRCVRQYLAFRAVPAADDHQHFLLGHTPRVSED